MQARVQHVHAAALAGCSDRVQQRHPSGSLAQNTPGKAGTSADNTAAATPRNIRRVAGRLSRNQPALASHTAATTSCLRHLHMRSARHLQLQHTPFQALAQCVDTGAGSASAGMPSQAPGRRCRAQPWCRPTNGACTHCLLRHAHPTAVPPLSLSCADTRRSYADQAVPRRRACMAVPRHQRDAGGPGCLATPTLSLTLQTLLNTAAARPKDAWAAAQPATRQCTARTAVQPHSLLGGASQQQCSS